MARHVKAGTRVQIDYAGSGALNIGRGRREADHGQSGTILEEGRIGPDAGWDVYDVRLDDGRETFAYGFNLRPAPKKQKKPSPSRQHATIVRDSYGDPVTVVAVPAADLRRGDIIRMSSDSLRIEESPIADKGRIKIVARSAKQAGGLVRRSYLASQVFDVERAESSTQHATKKSPAQLDREIAEALAQAPGVTAEQIERYRSGRKWGWPADLAFKSATGRPLSRTPGSRSHATKKTSQQRRVIRADKLGHPDRIMLDGKRLTVVSDRPIRLRDGTVKFAVNTEYSTVAHHVVLPADEMVEVGWA